MYIIVQCYKIYHKYLKKLPFLGGLATTKLTLWRTIPSSIIAPVAVTTSICSPVSPNALPINPYLTFTHTLHVQGQGFIPFGCIEICLPIYKRIFSIFNTIRLSSTISLHCICYVNTLCQVNGCCFCATNDPWIHSTDEKPLVETRFMASPFRPTCLISKLWGKIHLNQHELKQNWELTYAYLVGPFLPGQVPLSLVKSMQCNWSKDSCVPGLKVATHILQQETEKLSPCLNRRNNLASNG